MIFAVFYVWSLIALTLCYKTPVFTVDYKNTGWLRGRGVRDHVSVKRRKVSPLRRVAQWLLRGVLLTDYYTARMTLDHRVARDSHRLRGGDYLYLVYDVTTITEREIRSSDSVGLPILYYYHSIIPESVVNWNDEVVVIVKVEPAVVTVNIDTNT